MKELEISNSVFENIKRIDEEGNEYWLARELMPLLEYNKQQIYACYLIAQSGDNRKKAIFLTKTYFVVQQERWNYQNKTIIHYLKMKKEFIKEIKLEKEIILLIKLLRKQALKFLINFITQAIWDYIMVKQLMIQLKEKD